MHREVKIMKKAQGISLHTIVIAALALIVLVVLVLVFSGKIGESSKGVSEVQSSIGTDKCNVPGVRQCVASGSCMKELGQYSSTCPSDQICCAVEDIA